MSQDVHMAIDELGQSLDSGFETIRYTIETVGDKVIAQIALFHAPAKRESQVPSGLVDLVQKFSIQEELIVLHGMRTWLSTVKDAFSPCIAEVEQAQRLGRINDYSFQTILMAWGHCKEWFLPKLSTFVSESIDKMPSIKEHFSELERLSEKLDRAIVEDQRGEIPGRVADFGSMVQVFVEAIDIRFRQLLDSPRSIGGQTR